MAWMLAYIYLLSCAELSMTTEVLPWKQLELPYIFHVTLNNHFFREFELCTILQYYSFSESASETKADKRTNRYTIRSIFYLFDSDF